MVDGRNTDAIGISAMIIGTLLFMGALMFLLVLLLNNQVPRILFIPPVVQMVLGLVGSMAGFFLRRGQRAAKFVLVLVAIGVVAYLVFLVLLASAFIRGQGSPLSPG